MNRNSLKMVVVKWPLHEAMQIAVAGIHEEEPEEAE
jgi:hypothetical protein